MEDAYNKVVNDWNIQNCHAGHNVQHGHGLWAISQTSFTEYSFTASHVANIMCLKLPLNLIDSKKLERVHSVHF